MARNRTPLKKAEVAGRTIVNPGRYGDRKTPSGARPVGDPYPRMTEDQKRWWQEFAEDMPWLSSSHRTLLRLACYHAARLEAGGEFGVSATQALSGLLSKLGATPVDETKVSWAEDDDDPDGAFFGRAN